MTDMLEWQYTTTAVHTMSSKLSIGKSVVRFNQAARYIKRKVRKHIYKCRNTPFSEIRDGGVRSHNDQNLAYRNFRVQIRVWVGSRHGPALGCGLKLATGCMALCLQ